MLKRLWHDDGGALIATEWVLLCSLMVLAIAAGARAVQQSVTGQLEEVGAAINSLEPQSEMSRALRGSGADVSRLPSAPHIENKIDVHLPPTPDAKQRGERQPNPDPCD